MSKTARLFIAALGAGVFSAPAAAGPVYGVFNFGFDFGGEKLIEVQFSDGSTDDIKTGDGLYLAAGIGMTSGDGKYDGQMTLGWKNTGISASNGDLDWTRWPLEALAFFNHEKVRLGGGIAYHINNTLEGTGVVSGEADFDNALGFIVEGQYWSAGG